MPGNTPGQIGVDKQMTSIYILLDLELGFLSMYSALGMAMTMLGSQCINCLNIQDIL
jgi:hypothetical protein